MIMMILLPTDGQGLWAESQHVVTASSILSISSPAEDQQRMKAVDVFLNFFTGHMSCMGSGAVIVMCPDSFVDFGAI